MSYVMSLISSKIIRAYLIITVILLSSGCASKVGEPLTYFSVTTIDGQVMNNENLKGKIVVINVWATWCGPCIREIPHLNKLVESYKDKNVVFVALTDESKDKVTKFLTKRPFNYQHISDASSINNTLYPGMVAQVPLHVIVNKEGEIAFFMKGASNDIQEILTAQIDLLD